MNYCDATDVLSAGFLMVIMLVSGLKMLTNWILIKLWGK